MPCSQEDSVELRRPLLAGLWVADAEAGVAVLASGPLAHHRSVDHEIRVQLRTRGALHAMARPLPALVLAVRRLRHAGAPTPGSDWAVSGEGQAVGARFVMELLQAVGVERMLVADPHTAQLEAMVSIPLDSVSAVGLLAEDLVADLTEDAVVVAPDLGAAKRADRYAERLGLPTALVSKTRLDGRRVEVDHVVGDVRDRVPLIVDDMISTGGTIAAAVEALRAAGSADDVRVAATHGLFVEDADDTLAALPLQSVVVTDTLPRDAEAPFPLLTRSIAPLLAAAIERLAADRPLGDLAVHG